MRTLRAPTDQLFAPTWPEDAQCCTEAWWDGVVKQLQQRLTEGLGADLRGCMDAEPRGLLEHERVPWRLVLQWRIQVGCDL